MQRDLNGPHEQGCGASQRDDGTAGDRVDATRGHRRTVDAPGTNALHARPAMVLPVATGRPVCPLIDHSGGPPAAAGLVTEPSVWVAAFLQYVVVSRPLPPGATRSDGGGVPASPDQGHDVDIGQPPAPCSSVPSTKT